MISLYVHCVPYVGVPKPATAGMIATVVIPAQALWELEQL
jgi:hypothetical protein